MRTWICVLAVAMLSAVAGARADDPPVPPLPEAPSLPGTSNLPTDGSTPGTPDTAYTPQVQTTGSLYGHWTYVGGLKVGDSNVPQASPTPATVDFDTVAFARRALGFAGGSACANGTPVGKLDTCDRVPVIWKYSEGADGTGTWSEDLLDTGPGFVGAIAFFPGTDRALAVGGTGKYPYYEQPAGAADPAGAARAWEYDGTSWQAVAVPKGMSGLTALALSPRPSDCGASAEECGFAGGFQQLWRWTQDGFSQVTKFVNIVNSDYAEGMSSFRFRVRQMRFMPGESLGSQRVAAVAVTSGCCAQSPADNEARVLVYDGDTWSVQSLGQAGVSDSPDNTTNGTGVPTDLPNTTAAPSAAQTLPDSWFSLIVGRGQNGDPYASVLASDGASEAAPNASRIVGAVTIKQPTGNGGDAGALRTLSPIIGPTSAGSDVWAEAANPRIASIRLLAGDGDLESAPGGSTDLGGRGTSPRPGPDQFMDWAVGEDLSTGKAVAFTSTREPHSATGQVPNPITCNADELQAHATECKPDPAGATSQLASAELVGLPTYRLNGFTIVDSDGLGWAVGDRGAIVRLGGSGTISAAGAQEPPAPQLGAHDTSNLPDTTPYDAFTPLPAASEPGRVPALLTRLRDLPTPELISAGSPDPDHLDQDPSETVAAIAMSRDGSEGWAAGSNESTAQNAGESATLALFHYEGGTWHRCAVKPTGDQVAADPACASLTSVRNARTATSPNGVRILAMTRVPLEYDADPSNDDDFEVVAFGTSATLVGGDEVGTILRYRSGRWSFDKAESVQLDALVDHPSLAFASPTDGWLVSQGKLHHLGTDGRWSICNPAHAAACDDPKGLLSAITTPPSLAVTRAGRRVYLYGATLVGGSGGAGQAYPVILYRDSDKPCTPSDQSGCWTDANGGLNPASAPGEATPADQGVIYGSGLSVSRNADGSYSGWALGCFGVLNVSGTCVSPQTAVLHLDPGSKRWVPWQTSDATANYFLETTRGALDHSVNTAALLTLPAAKGEGAAFIAQSTGDNVFGANGPLLKFDPADRRWQVQPAPFSLLLPAKDNSTQQVDDAAIEAIAPDNRGGFWVAARQVAKYGTTQDGLIYKPGVYFYHYTRRAPVPVFNDVSHPIREPITAATAGPGGSFWVATASNTLYRYTRLSGWDSVDINGWDPGRVVTRASQAHAIAIGPDGRGLVVGEGGRIANVSPTSAVLDAAAGARCTASQERCGGTSQDLRAAAIAPDGSAMVAGAGRALLWRAPGGQFVAIAKPNVRSSTVFTGAAFPAPDRAWLTTDSGAIYAGQGSGGAWSWRLENVDRRGIVLNQGPQGVSLALHGIAIDPAGRGFAVGNHGLILERTGDSEQPWRRIDSGFLGDLWSVALPQSGGDGALIGGEYGQILTYVDGAFQVANQADPFGGVTHSVVNGAARIVGLALLPGYRAGDIEAWAAEQVPFDRSQGSGISYNRSPAPQAILHYSSNPSDTLLSPDERAKPIPDAPQSNPNEISFALFGKSDCQRTSSDQCPEQQGANFLNETTTKRIADDLTSDRGQPGAPSFALFTGDVGDTAGTGSPKPGNSSVDYAVSPSIVHDNWTDLVADRLRAAKLPLFGAIGKEDLSQVESCTATGCISARGLLNASWRQAFASQATPWGTTGTAAPSSDGLSFEPVAESGTAAPDGGARTHYAVDISRNGQKLMRLIVLDTSRGSLSGSDATQNPIESQASWLTTTLAGAPDGHAIVLSTTPTYSYNAQLATGTESDATALEAIVQGKADLVVSGGLGWNGRYWSQAAGVHYPCPGASYAYSLPDNAWTKPCSVDTGSAPSSDQVINTVTQALTSLQAPAPTDALPGVTQYVVASGAGGKYGPDGNASGTAGDGFWHGYTVVRMFPDGTDFGGRKWSSFVEQRPVFDWIGMSAALHVMKPGQKMTLHGFGREAVGMDAPISYDNITTPAITHRYDLVEADPEHPWLPKVDAASAFANHYVPLDQSVAYMTDPDHQDGKIQTGKGNHGRIYALAILSVGKSAATWPLVFEPRNSYVPKPPKLVKPPQIPTLHPPAIRVLAQAAESLPSQPPPSPPVAPTVQSLAFPAPPALPALPPLNATSVAPPTPPPPPPPPNTPHANALNLDLNIAGLKVPPPASPIPPPSPPIQPAPPGGARREARQRQAAVAKSDQGGDGGEARSDAQGRIDAVDSPNASMVRRDRVKPGQSFTPLARASNQPSSWTTALEWGGGMTLMALALALGWTTVRPTPRRRHPDAPAPAWVRSNTRQRR